MKEKIEDCMKGYSGLLYFIVDIQNKLQKIKTQPIHVSRGVSSTRLLLDTRVLVDLLLVWYSNFHVERVVADIRLDSILDCYYSSRSTSNKIPVTYEFLAMFRQFFEILGYFPPNFQIFGLFFTKISILGFVFSHFCL